MPVLTRIPLNPLRSGAQRLLSNPQYLHAAIAASAPSGEKEPGRVLWRLDRLGASAQLWVQTPGTASFEHIIEQAGAIDVPDAGVRAADLQPLLDQLHPGQRWGFRITANPVHSTSQGGAGSGRRGVVRAHTTPEHQLRWFLERASGGHGFKCGPTDVQLMHRDRLKFRKSGSSTPLVLATATFQGVLQVSDAGLLRSTLTNGLGRAKGYGCGLLTLAKV